VANAFVLVVWKFLRYKCKVMANLLNWFQSFHIFLEFSKWFDMSTDLKVITSIVSTHAYTSSSLQKGVFQRGIKILKLPCTKSQAAPPFSYMSPHIFSLPFSSACHFHPPRLFSFSPALSLGSSIFFVSISKTLHWYCAYTKRDIPTKTTKLLASQM